MSLILYRINPLKAILAPLKCKIEAFYYINQKPHLSSQTNGGTHVIIKIFIKYEKIVLIYIIFQHDS